MKVASLLIELHTEELPPKSLKTLSEAFAAGIEAGLRARQFLSEDSAATAFATPRRLAVRITHVKSRSADQPFRQKLLPAAIGLDALGNATAALLKKLKSLGVDIDIKSLARESDGKQDVLVYEGVKAGETLVAALQAALDEAIAKLPIAKVMSYQLADGETTVNFVRPAHRLIALHGHEVVPVQVLGLRAGTKTFGHRFHAPGELAIHSAETYEEQLKREGKLIASFGARRARMLEWLTKSAEAIGATPVMPDDLLHEVTALVELPVVYESGFEAEFLTVPQECLILTMQQNQKYFALKDANGRLINRFLLVSNIRTDDPSAIVAGNARVVRARLADAKFFYDQDRKQTLESRVPGLANVVYHNKLGSQLDRVERVIGIAVEIAKKLKVDVTHVERAARLAKADLRTLMVGEFPELQGLMGRYYALHDGEHADIADAIEQHYWPRFSGDALPIGPVATCVALADKLETIVSLFGVGERPTGDKDPFALRRHALGVLRILVDKRLALELPAQIEFASDVLLKSKRLKFHTEAVETIRKIKEQSELKPSIAIASRAQRLAHSGPAIPETPEGLDSAILDFFIDRLRGLLREGRYEVSEIEAVLASMPTVVAQVPERLAAVRDFMSLPESESLAAANKRIGNILKKASSVPTKFDDKLLIEPAEKELAAATAKLAPQADKLFAAGDYAGMLRALAPPKAPVDRFFDTVLVNAEDPKLRDNRLALLAQLRTLMNRVADLSQLSSG
jgi:glycyl-tRNA synthetase beta chain